MASPRQFGSALRPTGTKQHCPDARRAGSATSDSAYSDEADSRVDAPLSSELPRRRPIAAACCSAMSTRGICTSTTHNDDQCSSAMNDNESRRATSSFTRPSRILVLSKMTRLMYERKRHNALTEEQLIRKLCQNGGNYEHLLDRHNHHHRYLDTIKRELDKHRIEYKVVHRFQYTEDEIDKADMIFTAGGDGTFLSAAAKIKDSNKPVVGINTDPAGSEGYMCLMNKLPETYFAAALDRLLNGDFTWLFRQRVRITVDGPNAWDDPIELHDQQLLAPECRWVDHVREHEESGGAHLGTDRNTNRPQADLIGISPSHMVDRPPATAPIVEQSPPRRPARILPVLALNEVFVGESVSSRVSYYEMSVDGSRWAKYKSSGLTVCTGTGSTSWYFNINRVSPTCVSDLLEIINTELDARLPVRDLDLARRVANSYNRMLVFDPSEPKMAFVMRDPIVNKTFQCAEPRGFANTIEVRSRCSDAHLAIDGGLSFAFNTGSTATFEIRPEDALRTVVFR